MLEFLIDNIFVMLGGRVFQQTVGTYVLLFSSTCSFIRMKHTSYMSEKNLGRSFNFTFHYIDDTLSLNNSKFGDFLDCFYPIEIEIKITTDTVLFASHIELHVELDSEGWLRKKHYDKRDDFNFPSVNFPIICSDILAAPA